MTDGRLCQSCGVWPAEITHICPPPATTPGLSFWPLRGNCPDAARHRPPMGPCEDIGQCAACGTMTFSLRPEGETFGFHERDCSLPIVHEGQCVGGGSGHPPGHVRGWWMGFEADLRAEREWWASRDPSQQVSGNDGGVS